MAPGSAAPPAPGGADRDGGGAGAPPPAAPRPGVPVPWLAGFGLFFAYPLAATVYFSFTRYNLFTLEYAGLDNYTYLLHDRDAWTAMRNTLWLVAVLVPLRVLFGLGVAQLLTRIKRGGNLLRSVFYLPYLIPPVSATVAFVFLVNPAPGRSRRSPDGSGSRCPTSSTTPRGPPGLTVLALWAVGDIMIIMLAALLNVPASLYEAAAIDGAGAWARFRHITLPTVSPVLAFAAVTGVIETLQYFTQPMVAGKVASGRADLPGTHYAPGYPGGSTLTFPQWLYDQGFRQFNMGYACVLALVMFATAMLFTLFLLRRFRAFAGGGAVTSGNRLRRGLLWVAVHATTVALAVMFLAPLAFMLLTAVMTDRQALTGDLRAAAGTGRTSPTCSAATWSAGRSTAPSTRGCPRCSCWCRASRWRTRWRGSGSGAATPRSSW